MKPYLIMLGSTLLAMVASVGHTEAPPISGYQFMAPETQQLQDDDFLNPAMFLVEKGATLWGQEWTDGGATCQSCHQDIATDMAGVAAVYPRTDPVSGGLVSLEMKVISEIAGRLGAAAPAYGSEDLLALTALIGFQSRGMPTNVAVTPDSAPWIEKGREIFYTRRGQLNLSCANCHQDHWGDKLRGDTISQGQINAFPIYRLTWSDFGSRQRMFTWCMESIRAEPYDYGSDEYLALEAFLAVRGAGLAIETPGVRR
jgi:sulfur-oxidizing protein SoxA